MKKLVAVAILLLGAYGFGSPSIDAKLLSGTWKVSAVVSSEGTVVPIERVNAEGLSTYKFTSKTITVSSENVSVSSEYNIDGDKIVPIPANGVSISTLQVSEQTENSMRIKNVGGDVSLVLSKVK